MARLGASIHWSVVGIVAFAATGLILLLSYGSFWFAYLFLNRWPSQEEMVHSGYKMIPEAKQFDDLWENVRHGIYNYQEPDIADWHTKALFAGRYELVMSVDVRVDRQSGQVLQILGKPRFMVHEMNKLTLRSGRVREISYQNQFEFGLADWNKVVASGGDLSVIGIPMKFNQPVANFDILVASPRHGIQMRGQRNAE